MNFAKIRGYEQNLEIIASEFLIDEFRIVIIIIIIIIPKTMFTVLS